MAGTTLEVLYEDNHLLALNKPVGMATQGAEGNRTSLLSLAKAYLKEKYHKPGNVFLGTVSRLDSAVSGVVVFARTSKAAARLAEQFRSRTVRKIYWAVVSGSPATNAICEDWLAKDETRHRMRVVDPRAVGALAARLTYRRLKRVDGAWLLEVTPETGRKHQIRVQLAARNLPILGDQKYGGHEPFPGGIALHGRLLELVHPTLGKPVTLLADPPAAWRNYGVTPERR